MPAGDSCTEYTVRWVELPFTGTTVCCALCPLLETYARKQCRRTGEYIVNERGVGYWCPLRETPESPPDYMTRMP